MESALIKTPPISSASAKAWADLPLAVGPAIRTASKLNVFAFLLGHNVCSECHRQGRGPGHVRGYWHRCRENPVARTRLRPAGARSGRADAGAQSRGKAAP